MKPPPPLPFFLLLFLLHHLLVFSSAAAVSPTPSPTSSPTTPTPASSHSTLDPKQLQALESLNIPTSKDPCTHPNTTTSSITCDASSPFRNIVSLSLSNCSSDLTLSLTALKSLSSLHSLSFHSCPSLPPPSHLPSSLSLSLYSFSAVSSFRRLTGVFLSRLVNLTDLTVTSVPISTSGLYVILGNMRKITTLTISHANLTGFIPKHFHSNLTHIDLSDNKLKGKIPTTISTLESLEFLNLSHNSLTGEIPASLGDLISLKNLSLASNTLSGPLPDSISSIPGLVHLDLSGNQLNGSVPSYLSEMKHLKHLNLADNAFNGVLPFNATFLKRLEVFKIGGNSNLCYNRTVLSSSKIKMGIAPCDKHGLPMSPPPQKEDSEADSSSDYSDGGDGGDGGSKKEEHHGPNKVVLGVAIGLSSIVFLIVFLILLSKWCG